MSSIDNRIVILTFDNKDFEKNVQTSMNTLDKLKNNLDLSQSSKGLTALAASAKSFDLGPMGRAIESIKDRFSSLGIVGMTVLQNLTNTAVDFGKRLINAAIEPLTSGGWKRALDIEQATFQMEGLLGKTEGGAEKIKAIMQEVQESVKGTAFGANEAARVASQLVATGVEDAQQMRKYLDGVAGAAAMTGGAYDEIGHIFTTVAGQGKLMGEQLNQFAYRGLNIAATLSRQMGITEAEFRDLVRKGKISFDQFAEGMAIAFGEQATKANETFTGSLANMRAALARIGQDVATPALKYLRDLFNSLRLLIDAVHERLKPFIETLNNRLTKAAKNATEFIDDLTEALGGVSARMKKEMDGAAESTEDAASSISQSAEEIEEAAQKVIRGDYGNGEERRQQLEALGYSYEEVQNKVNELLGCDYRYEVQTKNTTEALKEAGKETDNLTIKSQTLSQALRAETFWNFHQAVINVQSALGQFGKAIKNSFLKVFDERNGEKYQIRIRNISKAFLGFTQSLMLNGNEQKGLQAILQGVFFVLDKVLKGALKGVELFFKFASVVANIRNAFFGFIGELVTFNGEVDETSRKSRLLGALHGVFTKVGEAIVGFKDKLVDVVKRVQNTGGFIKLKETLQQLWSTIKEIGGKIFDKVIEKMNKFAGTDLSFDWMDGLVSFLGKAAGHVADFFGKINNGIPKIKDFFKAIGDSETGKFGPFVDFLIKAKDAIKEFFSGVDKETGEINLFGSLKKIITDAMTNLGGFFADIQTSGFVEGFKTFIQNVISSFKDLDTQDAIEILKEVGKFVAEIIVFVTTIKLLKGLTKFFNGIGDFFEDVTGLKSIAHAQKMKLFLIAIGEILAGIYIISKIPTEDLEKSMIALATILGGAVLALKIVSGMSFDDKKITSFGIAMAGLGVGLLAIAGAAKILTGMSWNDILNSAGKMAIFAGIMAITARVAGMVKAGAAFMGLAVALNLLIPAIVILGHLKSSTINKAGKAIAIFAFEMGLAARLAGKVKAAAAFMGLALAIDLLIPALIILGKCKWETIKQGTKAIGIVVAELAIACRIASSANAGKGALAILSMAITLGVAAAALYALAKLDGEGLMRAVKALSFVMGEIALITFIAKGSSASTGHVLASALVIAAAATALVILAKQDWENMKKGMISLGLIMTAAGKAVKAAGANGGKDAFVGALSMAVAMGAAVLALYFLKDTPWEQLLGGAVALSALIIATGGALKLMKGVKWTEALGGAAKLGLAIDIIVGLVGAALFGIGKLAEVLDEHAGIDMAETIRIGGEVVAEVGTAIGTFAGNIVSGFGDSATSGLKDIADNICDFAEHMAPFFEKLKEYGTGEMLSAVGNFAKALLEITGAELLDRLAHPFSGGSSLEDFGVDLVTFGAYFAKFAEFVADVNYADITKMHSIAGAVDVLAQAAQKIPNQEVNGKRNLLSLIFGDNDIGTFGQELGEFSVGFGKFNTKLSEIDKIDSEKINAVASAVEKLAQAAQEIPNQRTNDKWNLSSFLFGDNNIGTFGYELEAFITPFKGFIDGLDKIDNIDSSKISSVAEAISKLGEAAHKIPNQTYGGHKNLASMIFGDNNLSMFGQQLSGFVGPFGEFVSGLNTMGDIDFDKISGVAKSVGELADAADRIPEDRTDSLISFILGNTGNLEEFGDQLAKFGEKFADFADDTKDISLFKAASIGAIVRSFATLATDLTSVAIGNLSLFGTDLGDLAVGINSFKEAIDGLNNNEIDGVTDSMTALVSSLQGLDGSSSGLNSLNESLTVFGGQSLASDIVNTFSNTEEAGKAVQGFVEALTPDFSAFKKAFGESAENAVKSFKEKFSLSQPGVRVSVAGFVAYAQSSLAQSSVSLANAFQTAANNAATNFVSGISGRNLEAYSAGSGLGSAAYSGLTSGVNHGAWYQVGVDCVNGFREGLGNAYANSLVVQAAAQMARNAINTAKSILRSASPSKVFIELGGYVTEGFAIGIKDGIDQVVGSTSKMTDSVIGVATTQLDRLQNALDFDLNLDPVITPVLDLSNVTSGANQINSMFGRAPIGLDLNNAALMGNLAVMSSNFGTSDTGNEDVVSAINGLKGGLNNMTFNITVDGAENPEDFVDWIVRSLKSRSRI